MSIKPIDTWEYPLFHSQNSFLALCKHPRPQTCTDSHTSGLMDEEIDGKLLCPVWWMTSFGQCADHVCLKVESPFSSSLCLPLIFPACYAPFPFESNSWKGPHGETPSLPISLCSAPSISIWRALGMINKHSPWHTPAISSKYSSFFQYEPMSSILYISLRWCEYMFHAISFCV